MNIRLKKITHFFIILFLLLLGECQSEDSQDSLFISGLVDLSAIIYNLSNPIIVAVTNTDQLEEVETDPFNKIIATQVIDKNDPFFQIDLSEKNLKVDDQVYILGFVDNDFSGGIPYPSLGDFVGFYQNEETKKSVYQLKTGPNRGLDFKIDRTIHDFSATIYYAIDKGKVDYTNNYPFSEIQEIIMAVHEGGVVVTMDTSGRPNFIIDPDYILGITTLTPPEYDHDDLEVDRPNPFAEPRQLKISSALHVNIALENKAISGNVYLLAIIDENHDGKIDPEEDQVGYLNQVYSLNVEECINVPFIDQEICLPAGKYYYPEAIKIQEGENKDEGGEPYWLMFNYSDVD